MVRVALLVVVVFALGCFAGDMVAVVPVSAFEGFEFTKTCKAIDAEHTRCDGVVIRHKAMVEYVKAQRRPGMTGKLRCTPGE